MNESTNDGIWLVYLVGAAVAFVISVVVSRWVWRVDRMVELLEEIRNRLPAPEQATTSKLYCSVCGGTGATMQGERAICRHCEVPA